MPKFSIMIIDDQEADRYLLAREIERTGIDFELFEASDGEEALEFFADYVNNAAQHPGLFPPLLVFLDINMPMMDGFEFLEEYAKLVEARPNYHSSIFTMFTSSAAQRDIDRSRPYPFVKGFISKGNFTFDDFLEILRLHAPEHLPS